MQRSNPVLRRRVWQRIAAFPMAVAWVVLGYGLLLSTADRDAWGELEAGGRFAANIGVYLPFYMLTLPVTVVVILGLVSTRDLIPLLLTSTAAGIGLFVCWVALNGYYLFEAQPQLLASLKWCFVADVAALVALIGVWLAHPLAKPVPSDTKPGSA